LIPSETLSSHFLAQILRTVRELKESMRDPLGPDANGLGSAFGAAGGDESTTGRPRSVTDGELRRVGDIVRSFVADGRRGMTRAVMNELDVNEPTATKRIRQARDRGFAPPSK
jgi:hypothetical protein